MTDPHSIDAPPPGMLPLSEVRAGAFVWSVWSACLFSAILFIAVYGANVPRFHDFEMIPAMLGKEPVTLSYLWEPSNEHRMFLPKLVIVGLGRLTHCDFRAERFFHVACLAAFSLAMMLTARRLRGRVSYVDAFFPLLFLSVGNCVSCLDTLAHVLEGAIPCLALAVVLFSAGEFTWKFVTLLGICALLLPLCGSGGVVFVPVLVGILLCCAVVRVRRGGAGTKRDVSLMLGFVAAAVFLVFLYCHGLAQRDLPARLPFVVSNFFGFFAMSVGAGGRQAWQVASAVVLLFVAIAVGVVVRNLLRHPRDTIQSVALLGFLGSFLVLALAVAWGRSYWGPHATLSFRFPVLATPVLCAVFFSFQLYRKRTLAMGLQCALLALVIVALPFNIQSGMEKGRLDRAIADRALRDARGGVEPYRLAVRNRQLYPFWPPHRVAERLEMLVENDVGPFGGDYRESLRVKGFRLSGGAGHPTNDGASRPQRDLDYVIQAADAENQKIVFPNGTVVQVRNELKFGSVGSVNIGGRKVVCKGWAADVAMGAPVDSVLIFIDGKCRFHCDMKRDGVPRQDVVRVFRKLASEDVGFLASLPANWFAGVGPDDVRFFAVRGDVAAELKRSEEFWRLPSDFRGGRTAQHKNTSRK